MDILPRHKSEQPAEGVRGPGEVDRNIPVIVKRVRSGHEQVLGEDPEAPLIIPPSSVSPIDLLPSVDSKKELAQLRQKVGASGCSELQRSNFYRIEKQIDALRAYIQELPAEAFLRILNIGPAHAEEASMYAVLAHSAGVLNRTKIRFVDLVTREMIHPNYSLGMNILKQPIAPRQNDQIGFTFIDGQWQVRPEVQQFVNTSLDQEGNIFGTAVEEFLRTGNTEKYKIVTFNNVAQYLGQGFNRYDNPIYQNEGVFETFQAVILAVAEQVEAGGLLLMGVSKGVDGSRPLNLQAIDIYLHARTNFDQVFETMDKKSGIYRRKDNKPLEIYKDS